MATEPVKVLDGIVRGIVFAGYDFVRLSLAGFLTPLVVKSRRFWRTVLAANERLSSLTYLALWILLTISIGLGTSRQLVSGVVGLSKTPDVTLPAAIVISLAVVLIVDVLLRAILLPVRNRIKHEMYVTLGRIGVANILLGACIMMLILPPSWLLPPGFSIIHSFDIRNVFDANPDAKVPLIYPRWYIFLFSLPLAILVVKAFSIKAPIKKIVIGLAVVLGAPMLLTYAFTLSMVAAYRGDVWFFPKDSPSRPQFSQRHTLCKFGPNHIDVSTFLKFDDVNSLPIKSDNFTVQYDLPGGESRTATITRGSTDFILLNANYTPVALVAAYDRKPGEATPVEPLPCTLKFASDPFTGGEQVEVP